MILSVSIDLDPGWCYRQIYGLGTESRPDPVVAVATERFCELMGSLGVRGTLFVVGSTVEEPAACAALRSASELGHELANHTYSHRYDLSRQPEVVIAEEVEKGAKAVELACGKRPRGLRTPGYLLGPHILEAATRAGSVYDSSVLPSLAYQGVKAAAVMLLKLFGRQTAARLGDPREALSPNRPYRPDPRQPWLPGSGQILELPISTVLGVPLTGALLAMSGPPIAGSIGALASRRGFVNLELHGVDLMDIAADGLDPALGIQRDLVIPWQRKARAISIFVESLLRTHRALPLVEAASFLGHYGEQ